MRLRRNQKIGLAAAGGATAVGLAAALIYAARRPPKCETGSVYMKETGRCEPLVIVGYPGDDPGLTAAKRRFCTYPNGLSLEQRLLLQNDVFVPLVEAAGGLSWSGPDESNAGIADVAAESIAQLCNGSARPRTRQLALELARGAWWTLTGQTGQ